MMKMSRHAVRLNKLGRWSCYLLAALLAQSSLWGQLAVRGKTVFTMDGPPVKDGVVLVRDGKIAAVGPATLSVPDGFRVIAAEVVTPGLVDAHSTVGISGFLNYQHDREELERSAPVQPELRALDAYNPLDPLVEWVRSFGVTTLHTGHAPGELIAGQTMIVKTTGTTVNDAVLVKTAAVASTLGSDARKSNTKVPGTRGKMMAVLRADFIRAREYLAKNQSDDPEKKPPRDLSLETLGRVLEKDLPFLVTAQRAQDIATALRLQQEFDLRLILDGAAESYLMTDRIKAAGVPVIIHPTMARPFEDLENLSFETAARLKRAGIPVALQAGYESYVPKTRVVLFEAAIAAANGLTFEEALATITIDAARILGVDQRVGSLTVGKDGDLALYDGDPFEYTSHCVATIIAGEIVHEGSR